MGLNRLTRTTACVLTLVAAAALSGCTKEEPGVDEPAREGLAIDVSGVAYNVFLTRELNLGITPDSAYYDGPPAAPGRALYGVFLQTCNEGKKPLTSTSTFHVEDNQGNEYEPIELEENNAFAYRARELAPKDCIPEDGSVAQLGPIAAAMLLFDFPLEDTENRPLELKIEGPFDYATGERETKTVELDL
ncbi:MAG: hypothetical protein H0U24_06530 [Thermoleophilaceae bacterium]|nr:hypothetical protein [Thermoleophilaceae bacterium]